tara:strand:- start:946 stop:1821 length:876 start_codon:yes stop_codon:yes gene_type:complete
LKKIKIFCFGFGQVAKAFIKKLQNEKYDIELSVTSRGKSETKKFNNLIFHSYSFENDRFDERLIMELKKFDHILISIPPSKNNDIVIKNFSKVILENNLKWITYLSATSVYGDHKGKWVNENSTTKPSSQNGIMRLKAEKEWISFSKLKNLPLQIFRLSGIYSNENNVLKRLRLGNVNLINAKNHFFSRIHVDDIANILFKSLNKIKRNEIFNISDDKPSSSQEVTLYGVEILKLDKPKEINIDEIESEMMRNFYKDSKKIDNKKMKDYFEYSLKYPSYVEGLNDIKNHIF